MIGEFVVLVWICCFYVTRLLIAAMLILLNSEPKNKMLMTVQLFVGRSHTTSYFPVKGMTIVIGSMHHIYAQ
jgi:hypothetical protein